MVVLKTTWRLPHSISPLARPQADGGYAAAWRSDALRGLAPPWLTVCSLPGRASALSVSHSGLVVVGDSISMGAQGA